MSDRRRVTDAIVRVLERIGGFDTWGDWVTRHAPDVIADYLVDDVAEALGVGFDTEGKAVKREKA